MSTIKINNIGKIESTEIPFYKPLILFYGDIMSGKTTILNSVKICFGGSFPDDIIRHGQDEAFIQINFDDGFIRREFYRNKDGKSVCRPLVYVVGGTPVKRPVEAIKKIVNPFFLNQNHLIDMNEPSRRRYFSEIFDVRTPSIDSEIEKLEAECKDLRAKIKDCGSIDLTEHKRVSIGSLLADKNEMMNSWKEDLASVKRHNDEAREINLKIESCKSEIDGLESEIERLQIRLGEAKKFMQAHKKMDLFDDPKIPDTSDIDAKIQRAEADNLRAEQYEKNKKKYSELQEDRNQLKMSELARDKLRAKKISKLASMSQKIGIPGIRFDESGAFIYENTSAGMLSTSQLMKLSHEISDLYPPGIGVELIDRAESLGKSIFKFIDLAEENQRTILASIVGDAPSEVPEHVGVFVVEDGKVMGGTHGK